MKLTFQIAAIRVTHKNAEFELQDESQDGVRLRSSLGLELAMSLAKAEGFKVGDHLEFELREAWFLDKQFKKVSRLSGESLE